MLKHIFRAFLLLLIVTVHVTGFTPVGRYGQSAVLIGNTIYVYGGGTDYASFSNLYALDVSQPWNSTNPAPAWIDHTSDAGTFTVPAVEFHTMWPAADNSSIYIWGGGSSAMTTLPYNGFANYNVTTKTWSITSDSANVPQQRRFLSAAWTPSGVAYIWGGKGDQFTGYTLGSTFFDDMLTYDTIQWKTIGIVGQKPVPRDGYTATMLPNGKIVYIGGLIMQQINATYVSGSSALLSDILVFDTSTAAWIFVNATGNIPIRRYMHSAVLGGDGISIIICGGQMGTPTIILNDVAVLNSQLWSWTIPKIDDGSVFIGRNSHSSVMVNGQMFVLFGNKNGSSEPTSDINILETRTTPFKWITSFPPTSNTLQSSTYTPTTNATSPPNEPNSVNNLGLIIGTACGALTTVITAIAIFLVIRKRGRKRAEIVKTGSEPAPLPYVPNVGQVQQANPHNTPGGSTMPPENCQPAQGLQNYQPAQGLQNYQPAQGWHAGKGFPHSSSANSALPVIPLQYDYNKQPSQDVYANYQTNQQSNPYRSPAIPIRPTAQPPYYEGQLAQQGLPYTNPPLQPEKHHPVFVQENLNGSQPGDNTWRLSALAIGMPGDDRSSIVSGHKRFPPNEVDITVRESTNNSGNSNDGRFTPNEVDTSESQARNGYSDLPGAGEMDLGTWRAQHI